MWSEEEEESSDSSTAADLELINTSAKRHRAAADLAALVAATSSTSTSTSTSAARLAPSSPGVSSAQAPAAVDPIWLTQTQVRKHRFDVGDKLVTTANKLIGQKINEVFHDTTLHTLPIRGVVTPRTAKKLHVHFSYSQEWTVRDWNVLAEALKQVHKVSMGLCDKDESIPPDSSVSESCDEEDEDIFPDEDALYGTSDCGLYWYMVSDSEVEDSEEEHENDLINNDNSMSTSTSTSSSSSMLETTSSSSSAVEGETDSALRTKLATVEVKGPRNARYVWTLAPSPDVSLPANVEQRPSPVFLWKHLAIHYPQGTTFEAHEPSEIDCLRLMMPVEYLTKIVDATNTTAKAKHPTFADVSLGEFERFLAIVLYHCICSPGSTRNLWKGYDPKLKHTIFTAKDLSAMTKNRFEHIISHLTFPCEIPEQERDPYTQSWARSIGLVHAFNERRQQVFRPGAYLTEDESMFQWWGGVLKGKNTIPHSTNMPRKPADEGCEVKTLADTQSGVMMSVEVQSSTFVSLINLAMNGPFSSIFFTIFH